MTPDDAPFPVVRAADLEEADAAHRWLIDPLWAHAGVGIIGGAPKSYKSWLALDVAVSVASGTPCLDTFRVPEPGGALVYMAEDAASLVKATSLDEVLVERAPWRRTAPAALNLTSSL